MIRRRWLLIACALIAASCASSKGDKEANQPEPAQADSYVIVVNDYLGNIDLFIMLGSIRNRIGSITTGATKEFKIPTKYMDRPDVQFLVTPASISTVGFMYQPISMAVGSAVELHVNRILSNSTYQIRGQ